MDDIINESGEPIVDWDTYMRARRELGAGFARILGYFREDGDKSVARIEAAMHNKDAAALVLPAHTVKRYFPDDLLPAVAKLRPLYARTIEMLEREANPLRQRSPGFGRAGGT